MAGNRQSALKKSRSDSDAVAKTAPANAGGRAVRLNRERTLGYDTDQKWFTRALGALCIFLLCVALERISW